MASRVATYSPIDKPKKIICSEPSRDTGLRRAPNGATINAWVSCNTNIRRKDLNCLQAGPFTVYIAVTSPFWHISRIPCCTRSIHSGQPYSPPYYVVYGALSPAGPFIPIATAPENTFLHPLIVNSQLKYFYQVTAGTGGIPARVSRDSDKAGASRIEPRK